LNFSAIKKKKKGVIPLEISKEIMDALVSKDKITKRSWYKRIDARWRAVHCAYDKKIVALSFILQKGLDPRPFSDSEEREKLGELMKEVTIPQATQVSTPSKKPVVKRAVKIHELKLSHSLGKIPLNLGTKSMTDGKEMTEAYYTLWIFENSLRKFIIDTMESNYGLNWWSSHVSPQTQSRSSDRKSKEKANRWHSNRGAHEIFYVDISDYKGIITKNWSVFEPYFSGLSRPQEWILNRIDEITLSRNIVAHMNPLEKDDIERIKLYLRDWLKQIS